MPKSNSILIFIIIFFNFLVELVVLIVIGPACAVIAAEEWSVDVLLVQAIVSVFPVAVSCVVGVHVVRVLVFALYKSLLHAHYILWVGARLILAIEHELVILVYSAECTTVLLEVGVMRVDVMVLNLG